MKTLYESIISSNNSGAFSLDVFNKKIKDTFEKTFKSFAHLNKKKEDPMDFGGFCLGYPVRDHIRKWNVESQLTTILEKFLKDKEISVYKPVRTRVSFYGRHSSCWEIYFQDYPKEWDDEPAFFISVPYDDKQDKYWLLIEYDDLRMDEIFNLKNT